MQPWRLEVGVWISVTQVFICSVHLSSDGGVKFPEKRHYVMVAITPYSVSFCTRAT